MTATATRNGNGHGLAVVDEPRTEVLHAKSFTFQDMQQMSQVAFRSQMFGKMTEPQILMLMMIADSEKRHPIQALMMYDIVEGKPSIKPTAAIAKFQAVGGEVKWLVTTDTECTGVFTHHKLCPEGLKVTFTIKDAMRAGLAGKDNWKKYPEDCLLARVSIRGPKRVAPGALLGLYDPEDYEHADEMTVTIAEQTTRAALVEKMKGKLENNPKGDPTEESVIDVTATPAPTPKVEAKPEPAKATEPHKDDRSEMRRWVDEMIANANHEISGYAPNQKPIGYKAATNYLIDELFKRNSDLKRASHLKPDGELDMPKIGRSLNTIWGVDCVTIQDIIGQYLAARVAEVIPQETVDAARQTSMLGDFDDMEGVEEVPAKAN